MTDPTPNPVPRERPTEAEVHDAVVTIRRAAWSATAEGQRARAAQGAAHVILASDHSSAVGRAAQALIDARTKFDQAKADYLTARNAWMDARDELRDLTQVTR